jgi:hypothetical protein
MPDELRRIYRRISITAKGGKMTSVRQAETLSEALEQELEYYKGRRLYPALINISLED